LPGVDGDAVDQGGKTVTVTHDPAQSPLDKIKAENEDQVYDIEA
jgi:hypothetical protein